MNNITSLEAELGSRVAGKKSNGKTITLDLIGEGKLRIDGTTTPISVRQDETPSDATVTITADDFKALMDGTKKPEGLLLTGKAKMAGNPLAVMKLRDILA
jgi:putative sterol carrier protein